MGKLWKFWIRLRMLWVLSGVVLVLLYRTGLLTRPGTTAESSTPAKQETPVSPAKVADSSSDKKESEQAAEKPHIRAKRVQKRPKAARPFSYMAATRPALALSPAPLVAAQAGVATPPLQQTLPAQPEAPPPPPAPQPLRNGATSPNDPRVTITSDPAGADVMINGAFAGKTPLTVSLEHVGEAFTVIVMKDGYQHRVFHSFAAPGRWNLHASLITVPAVNR